MIFDLTGSYRAAFLNGLLWNLLNVTIVIWVLLRPGTRYQELFAAQIGTGRPAA